MFAENATLVAGAVNKVYVFTTYADGRPARPRVSGVHAGRSRAGQKNDSVLTSEASED